MKVSVSVIKFVLFVFISALQEPILATTKKSYVVYMGAHSHDQHQLSDYHLQQLTESHYDFLGSYLGSREKAKNAIFYSYTRHINGFAAILEEEHALNIAKHPNVISVFPNEGRKLHTTRSWSFLGLEDNGQIPASSLWEKSHFGEHTIIANLDTGVWPESKSFGDEGMGPIPSRWKGMCQNQTTSAALGGVHCNRKLIGARYFNKGYLAALSSSNITNITIVNTPRDYDGHGTHTLSTAGGSFIRDASLFGFGKGVAKGGSPRARVAAYKVCWPPINGNECYDSDILAGFDAAIADGVDVISASLGGTPTPYFNDSLSIGSFHAMMKNIVLVCSAGNSGPADSTVVNVSPWILTVGASTMDRDFSDYVLLANGLHLKGQSLAPKSLPTGKYYHLVTAVQVKAANVSVKEAQLCKSGTLDPKKAIGKIVVCLRGDNARVDKGQQVTLVGGVAMILANNQETANEVIADPHVLPASHINYSDGVRVYAYIESTKFPKASITRTTTRLNVKPAPFMAAFSSKGPNAITPEILKPDITAPGVSVIAAYTEAQGPTNQVFDKRRVKFNSLSGTSMSCPHVSGVVGLLKTLYPHWSPAAIKSAIMTTASIIDNMHEPIINASNIEANPFHYGAGHVQPNGAMDPGLVYDMTIKDQLNFLCALGYNHTSIALFYKNPYICPHKFNILNLNYPSITIPNLKKSIKITRTLKNVGSSGKYIAHVHNPKGISISIKPHVLEFTSLGQEKTFHLRFKAKKGMISKDYVFGRIIWSDGKHYVTSPIIVKVL
ncbi:subtilisin-like protease SBT5.3 [Amaranthus tricolor]|uniref:subtilisin-like protease SBT5.3 n=1 Tax=Amaranthus tricolor TaxID=29722 RepID=UPI00258E344B|nr:subtilisin-like protease SBT5.3 [Amaranthus tricolor]